MYVSTMPDSTLASAVDFARAAVIEEATLAEAQVLVELEAIHVTQHLGDLVR